MLPHGGCRHCVAELLGLMHFWWMLFLLFFFIIQCENLAREGLRTLVVAKRILNDDVYKDFDVRWWPSVSGCIICTALLVCEALFSNLNCEHFTSGWKYKERPLSLKRELLAFCRNIWNEWKLRQAVCVNMSFVIKQYVCFSATNNKLPMGYYCVQLLRNYMKE